MVTLDISRSDCRNTAVFLEKYFYDSIRDDKEMDNLNYARRLLHVIDELNNAAYQMEDDR